MQKGRVLDKTSFSREGLSALGLDGFMTIAQLRRTDLAEVPVAPGVYGVLRSDLSPPLFLTESSGGRWQGKDPNVPLKKLEAAWVDDAYVLYFGKGDILRDRIGLLLDFGAGKSVMHYGGRYLWHLDRPDLLQIAWVATEPKDLYEDHARRLEHLYIQGFRQVYGARPFANLQN